MEKSDNKHQRKSKWAQGKKRYKSHAWSHPSPTI